MALTKINTDALSDNAVTLAKMASGTDGEILTYDASGNPVAVSVGTDGQVLTSTGAGSPPAFEAAAAGGITEADTWRLTSGFTGVLATISANLERDDSDGNGLLGSGVSHSSGVWSFPSTGFWYVTFFTVHYLGSSTSKWNSIAIEYSADAGSSWDRASENVFDLNTTNMSYAYSANSVAAIFDITDTANHKIKFGVDVFNTSVQTDGNTNKNATYMTFVKLGET